MVFAPDRMGTLLLGKRESGKLSAATRVRFVGRNPLRPFNAGSSSRTRAASSLVIGGVRLTASAMIRASCLAVAQG